MAMFAKSPYIDELIERAATNRCDRRRRKISRFVALAIVLVAGIDVISTNMALLHGHIEANPIVSFFLDLLDHYWIVPKILTHWLFALFVLWLPSALMLRVGAFVIVGYFVIGLNNFYVSGILL